MTEVQLTPEWTATILDDGGMVVKSWDEARVHSAQA